MAYGSIYLVSNRDNGKPYVGQTTTSIDRRWSSHVSLARTTKGGPALCRAIRKHGRAAFSVECITQCPDQPTLDAVERFWIGVFGAVAPGGYNLTAGGMSGVKQTDDVRRRKAISQRRRFVDPEVRGRQGSASRRSWALPETKAKASASHAAHWTPERRREWADKYRAEATARLLAGRSRRVYARRPATVSERPQYRGISVVATKVETGETQMFRSASAAGRALQIATSSVHYALHKGEPLHGFILARREN
jgi:group I intron endonuclease